jgi:DNA-binding response OmpR family regulator
VRGRRVAVQSAIGYLFSISPDPLSKTLMQRSYRPGVLLVEDEEELLTLVALAFEGEQYAIFRARNGSEGLEVFRKRSPEIHLVLTDLGLPGVSGPDLIAAIRKIKPSVKIVGTSGFGGDDVRALALSSGADLFCEKPYKIQQLVESIRTLLEQA